MSDFLLFGDTERSAALRHEVPVVIGDPFLFAEVDGRAYLLSNALDRANMARARPDAILLDFVELGFRELAASGMPAEAVQLELVSRAVKRSGIRRAIVMPQHTQAGLPRRGTPRLRLSPISIPRPPPRAYASA